MSETGTILLFIAAILVNAAAVFAQGRYAFFDRFGRYGYWVFRAIVSPVWLASIFFIIRLSVQGVATGALQHTIYGELVFWSGALVILLAAKEIGPNGPLNKDLFGAPQKKLQGIYSYVSEPMYLGFSMVLFGKGIATGIFGFYILGIISVVGLQGFLAAIERLSSKK